MTAGTEDCSLWGLWCVAVLEVMRLDENLLLLWQDFFLLYV